ncbi:hypothetical protein VPH35_009305 [Triticum aestivum]
MGNICIFSQKIVSLLSPPLSFLSSTFHPKSRGSLRWFVCLIGVQQGCEEILTSSTDIPAHSSATIFKLLWYGIGVIAKKILKLTPKDLKQGHGKYMLSKYYS